MSIILFSGSEPFLKEEALNRLKTQVLSERNKDLNYSVFYGEDPNIDLSATLNTVGFFGEKRLIVIKNVDRLSAQGKTHLLAYVKRPLPAEALLVLDTNQTDLCDDFLSLLARYAKVTRCAKLHGSALYDWIYKRALACKKRIPKSASRLLVEFKGNDLRTLAVELDKLAAYAGTRPEITVRDIEELVGKGLTHGAFDLVAAVSRRDCGESLKLVSQLAGQRKGESEIIGLLGWQFKRLWKAKELQKDGIPKPHIAKTLNIPARYLEEFFDYLNRFDIDTIKRNLKILVETDRDLKRGVKERSLILELMIVRLCNA